MLRRQFTRLLGTGAAATQAVKPDSGNGKDVGTAVLLANRLAMMRDQLERLVDEMVAKGIRYDDAQREFG